MKTRVLKLFIKDNSEICGGFMIDKKYVLTLLALIAGTGSSLYSMRQGWAFMQRVANDERLRQGARNIGDGLERGLRDGVDWWHDRQARASQIYQERINRLHRDAYNMRLSEGERIAARQQLGQIERERDENQHRWREREDAFVNGALNIGLDAVKGVVAEGFAQAKHERDKDLLAVKTSLEGKAGLKKLEKVIDAIKNNPQQIVFLAGGISLAASLAYYGSKYGSQALFEQYKKPELADPEKTSLHFGWQKVKDIIYGKPEVESDLKDVVLEPELAARINELVEGLKNTVANGAFLKNVLLYGPPGTGKTMCAMRVAHSCGLEFIYFSASALESLSLEEGLRQLTELFRFAQNSPKKLMIIIDEAEKLFANRKRPGGISDKTSSLLTHVLTYTGTETRDYMVVALTNLPEHLDAAFLSRCDDRIRIGLPGPDERRDILQKNIEKELIKGEHLRPPVISAFSYNYWFGPTHMIKQLKIQNDTFTDEYIDHLRDTTEGFTGRDLKKMVGQMYTSGCATADCTLTREIVDRVVRIKKLEKEAENRNFAQP
jgi:SpoVK/Ycf46/Vps4 family AAA+-type ATPase